VPPWDYDAPAESRRQVDTSAAAIAASGLLQLGRDHTGGTEGILNHGVYHIHKGPGVNESVMWGGLSGCGLAFQRIQPAGRPHKR
jgi:unsaturated chondroitin disaccharide hydrolase